MKCPFGITFVGCIVQRVLQQLFHDLSYVTVYIDDVIISTEGPLSHHTSCVAEVIRRLTESNLVVSAEKWFLGKQ